MAEEEKMDKERIGIANKTRRSITYSYTNYNTKLQVDLSYSNTSKCWIRAKISEMALDDFERKVLRIMK